MRKDGLPLLAFADADAFSRWLSADPDAAGAWLKFAKAGAVEPTLSKAEAVDCALCHGWIDGQLGRFDDAYFLTRFTPRRAGGRWSAKNAARADALVALGRMRPGGLAEIEAAKADGRWAAAYPSAARIEIPADFAAALRAQPAAAKAFEAWDSANRYALLYRLHHAKPEMRGQCIAEFVGRLTSGRPFHPPRHARPRLKS